MGMVYQARDARLHRAVAIKVLPDDLHGNEQARQILQRKGEEICPSKARLRHT
jgi:hypothetical protein